MAYAEAVAMYGEDRLNRVILLSDGGANVGVTEETLIGEHADDAESEGIYLVGVGMDEVGGAYDDALMDAVTALSGSGPAYFFLTMEAMSAAGEELGLSRETAHLLTLQTALGAARMAIESSETPERLRQRVTSPGGTTERALEVLEQGGNAFDAVIAAHWSACVAEPVLTSLGGGGFLIAEPHDGRRHVDGLHLPG